MHREPAIKNHAESGVTLLEMLVVMAILGIAAMFGADAMNGFLSGSGLEQSEYGLLVSAQDARHEASVVDTPVSVQTTGCNVTFSWGGQTPSGAPQLPSNFVAGSGITCSGGFNGYWIPSGKYVSSLSSNIPVDQSMTLSNAGGTAVTVSVDGGGAITHG